VSYCKLFVVKSDYKRSVSKSNHPIQNTLLLVTTLRTWQYFNNKVQLNLGINLTHVGVCRWRKVKVWYIWLSLLELSWLQVMDNDEYLHNRSSRHHAAYDPVLLEPIISSKLDMFWTGMSLMRSYNSNTEFWMLKCTLESTRTQKLLFPIPIQRFGKLRFVHSLEIRYWLHLTWVCFIPCLFRRVPKKCHLSMNL
jgi:hypothetical protein